MVDARIDVLGVNAIDGKATVKMFTFPYREDWTAGVEWPFPAGWLRAGPPILVGEGSTHVGAEIRDRRPWF